jgi:hypothetical protein
MNVTGIGPLPWRLQPEDADPPEWCEVVDATGAAVPFLSDFELDEVDLAAAIDALLRVVNHYPDLLAAARAVVETWDRWMATDSPDRPSVQDLDAAIDALRPSSAPWYAHP